MSNATKLLKRVVEEWDKHGFVFGKTIKEIISYLDAEPEAEPVGLIHSDGTFELLDDEGINFSEPVLLYLRPEPKRKPLTDDDAWKAYIKAIEDDHRMSGCWLFILGVRFAEKHHSISPRCENS
jgi:hypothetical protein